MVKRLNVKYLIQDTSSNWTTENPTMSEGVIAYESDTNKMKIFDGEKAFNDLAYVGGEGSSGGSTDYTTLTNKPQINSVELSGNKTLNDLGIQPVGDYATKSELSKYATTTVVNGKADKSTTLSGYGITDAYTKSEADGKFALETSLAGYATTSSVSSTYLSKTDATSTYATKASLSGYATTSSLEAKADKETTLAGYGITDAYTKTASDGKYATKAQGTKADTAVQPSALSAYVTTETATSTYATKASLSGYATTSALDGKADKSTTLSGYGITDAYTKSEADGKYALKSAIPSGDKIMTGTKASATVAKPAGEEVADVKTSLEALIDALSARGIITIS